jgi:hypothetical protein
MCAAVMEDGLMNQAVWQGVILLAKVYEKAILAEAQVPTAAIFWSTCS